MANSQWGLKIRKMRYVKELTGCRYVERKAQDWLRGARKVKKISHKTSKKGRQESDWLSNKLNRQKVSVVENTDR